MTAITDATRQYWLDTVLAWAESRLPPPQYDECKLALTTPAPFVLAALAEKNIQLAAAQARIRELKSLLTAEQRDDEHQPSVITPPEPGAGRRA